MNKIVIKKALFSLLALFSFTMLFNSCESWMADDNFYSDIEEEVKKANAPQINVYVRYAATKMGKTDPDGYSVFKVEIPSQISATTETDYGFWRWAAFSTSFLTPGDTQYTSLVYENDEAFNAAYADKELSADIVKFENPYSSTTTVTIYEERNDIYLVPVVAKRPTVALTMPASGSSGIVRNMTVRINFTKAMKQASFQDGNGLFDKITVTQGTQSITADGDIDISSEDITDRFSAPTFSTNGKMITLKFTEEAVKTGYTAQSYVTINISKEVTDEFGYSMAEDFKLQFQVGSSFDTLAPRISELTAGVGDKMDTFGGVYKDADTVGTLGSLTKLTLDGASKANKNIDNEFYTEDLCAARVKDKINIRVVAEDIAGSGSGQDATGVESDVAMLGMRAQTMVLMSGAAADDSASLPITSLPYVAQTNLSDIKGAYKDLTGSTKGYLFTYDLSKLPDGLIKIDIWGYDSIGNNGYSDGGSNSAEYGNGYASIFVVKDNTPPDAVADAALVRSSSAEAPYSWYNASSLGTMKLYEASAGAVVDNGHPKLRGKTDKLQWFFNVTADTAWAEGVTAEDARWKTVSEGYSISNAAIPAADGPVAISLILKDDLDNISQAAPLSTIVYDNTPPVVGALSWVDTNGATALNASSEDIVSGSILKIPFSDNLSGAKRFSVSVGGITAPLASAAISYAPDASTPPSAATPISPVADAASTNNVFVLPDAIGSGVIYISNLTIGSSDGLYTVSVSATDAAINTSESSSITIARDATNPVINSVTVDSKIKETNSNQYWLGTSTGPVAPTNATVSINLTEEGSGVTAITLSGTVRVTASTTVAVGGTLLTNGADYSLDITNNKINFPDSYNPRVRGSGITVTLGNVEFTSVNSSTPNSVTAVVTDFVSKPSASVTSGDAVYVDNTAPAITSVKVEDNAQNNTNGFENDVWATGKYNYTNSDLVTLTVTTGSESAANGSGIKYLILDGAEFTAATTVTPAGGSALTGTYSGSVFTFAVPFTDVKTLTITNVRISSAAEETKTISVTPKDFVLNSGSPAAGNTITLDTTAPVLTAIKWETSDGVHYVGGITNEQTELAYQELVIDYTEVTAGLKKLKLDISYNDAATTTKPFSSASLAITLDGTLLVKNTDYTVNSSQNEVTFTSPRLSGRLVIKYIHTTDSDRADYDLVYKVKATLMDAAENTAETSAKIEDLTRDNTKPVVDKVEIPGLKPSKEKAKGAAAQGTGETETNGISYWLDHEYIGGAHNSNYAATNLKVYITVTEKTSGIKSISLGGTLEPTAASKLYIVDAATGTETEAAGYTVDAAGKRINISDPDSAKQFKGDTSFQLLVTNVKASKYGGSTTQSGSNNISVTVTDYANNVSDPNTTITLKETGATATKFWTDSWNCGMDAFYLYDSGSQNYEGLTMDNANLRAASGYTNNSLLAVTATLGSEGKGASGHNKFVLTGAKFTSTTKVYYAQHTQYSSNANSYLNIASAYHSSNCEEIPASDFVISPDKTTLELRDASGINYVFRNATAIMFTDVQLDSAEDGRKDVSLQAYDLSGWDGGSSSSKSAYINLDTTKPTWNSDIFASASDKYASGYSYSRNIYPHPNGESAFGVEIPGITNRKFFYTSAKVGDKYGAVLALPCKDELRLHGYSNSNSVSCIIYKHTGTEGVPINADYVSKNGSIPSADINGNNTHTFNATFFKVQYFFEAGSTYSIVVVDDSGNYSEEVKTVQIVEDTKKPSRSISSSSYDPNPHGAASTFDSTNTLLNLVTVQTPDAQSKMFRNSSNKERSKTTSFDFFDSGSHSATTTLKEYVVRSSENKYKIVVKLGTGTTASDILVDGTAASVKSKYAESSATQTASPLDYYAVSHWFGNWNCEGNGKDYEPSFPNGTVAPDGTSVKSYFAFDNNDYSTWLTPNASWHLYAPGTSYTDNGAGAESVTSFVDADGNINIELPNTVDTPPLFLLMKDGCGNLNFLPLTVKTANGDKGIEMVGWVVDSKVGEGKKNNAPDGTSRNVGIYPFMGRTSTEYGVEYSSAGPVAFDIAGNEVTDRKYWGKGAGSYLASSTGQSVVGTIMRDTVTGITYYNDKAYMGLHIHSESCNYPTASASTKSSDDGNGWTSRARVRAWNKDSLPPQPSDFISPDKAEDCSSWYYLRSSSTTENNNFTLQYPHPVSRTEPFKIYYYVEDAVGNYEINTVVNDGADAVNLWMYDNTAPKLIVKGTTKTPDQITLAELNTLIPNNDGYRPYSDGTDAFVWNQNAPRNAANLASTAGNTNDGVTRYIYVPNETHGRMANPFFNLRVEETSGIRAMRYVVGTTAPTLPDISSVKCYDSSYTGADGADWYSGWQYASDSLSEVNTRLEIGTDFTSASRQAPSYYFEKQSYKMNDSRYNGKYSGALLQETFPVTKLSATTANYVWLQVIDWTGNISQYKMGNFKWKLDNADPINDDSSSTNIYKDDVNITSYGGTKYNLSYKFAATKNSVKDATVLKLYIPQGKYLDTASGSGLLGWSITPNDISSVKKDAGQTDAKYSYIEITGDLLTKIKSGESAGNITAYVYDNVGHCPNVTLNLNGDIVPIPYTLYARGASDSTGTRANSVVYDGTNSIFDKRFTTDTSNNLKLRPSSLADITDVSEITTNLYVAGDYFRFLTNFGAAGPSDLRLISVENWNGTAWETVITQSTGWNISPTHEDPVYHPVANYYITLNTAQISATKPYYRLIVRDKAGNDTFTYAKILKDVTAPAITIVPGTITNVNQVTSGGVTKNYYNSTATVKLKFEDTQSGIQTYPGLASPYTSYVTESPEFTYTLGSQSPDASEKLTLTAKDNLNNSAPADLTHNGVNKWVKDTAAPSVKDLGNQTAEYNIWWRNPSDPSQINDQKSPSANFAISETQIADGETSITTKLTATKITLTNYNISTSGVKKLKFTPASDSTDLLGWLVSLVDSGAAVTKPDFTSVSDITLAKGEAYEFTSVPADTKKCLFYPIDYAGNAGDPYVLTFAEAIIPDLTGINAKNEFTDAGGSIINNYIIKQRDPANPGQTQEYYYYNENSRLSVTVRNPHASTSISITSFTIQFKPNKDSGSNSHNIDVALASPVVISANSTVTFTLPLTNLCGTLSEIAGPISKQYFTVYVNTNFASSKGKQFSSTPFIYEGTGPANIEIESVKDQTGSNTYSYNMTNNLIYGSGATSLKVKFTSTDTVGVAGYAFSADSSEWTSELDFSTSFTGTKNVYAKDNLGNVSAATTVSVTKDTTAPVINSITDNTSTIEKAYRSGNTVTYGLGCANITFTVNAGDTYGPRGYIMDEGMEQPSPDFVVDPSTAGTHSFYAVDCVGNKSAATTITFTQDNTVAAPTVTVGTFKNNSGADVTSANSTGSGASYVYNGNIAKKVVISSVTVAEPSGAVQTAYSETNISAPETWVASGTDNITITLNPAITTYYIWSKDAFGNVNNTSISLVSDTTGPSGTASFDFMNGASAAGTGDYVITDGVTYYNSSVTDLSVSLSGVSDGVYTMPADYVCYSIGNGVKTAPASALTIDISSLTEQTEYNIYLVDKVGNYSDSVGSIKVQKHTTGPVVSNTTTPAYSGLDFMPTYNGENIKGIGGGHSLSTGTAEEITDSGTNIYGWNNGQPNALTTTNNYTIRKLVSGTTLTLPVSGLPSSSVWCELTYNSIVEPSSWSTEYTVSSSQITGVPIDVTRLDKRFMFIFVWYKDAIGNISVYNLTYPSATGQNWWTSDSGQNNSNVDSTTGTFSIATSAGGAAGSAGRTVIGSALTTVKSIFTPKTKKVDLSAQQALRLAEEERAYNESRTAKNSVVTKPSAVTGFAGEKQTKSALKAKTAPENKALKGRTSKADVSVLAQNSLPQDAEIMQAVAITNNSVQISEEKGENIMDASTVNTVEESHEVQETQNCILIFVIVISFIVVISALIGLIIFVNRKKIDKVN